MKGYCETCKHAQTRLDCLRKNLETKDWALPCKNCDIEKNYLWEA